MRSRSPKRLRRNGEIVKSKESSRPSNAAAWHDSQSADTIARIRVAISQMTVRSYEGKLSLTALATLAGVERTTLYRYPALIEFWHSQLDALRRAAEPAVPALVIEKLRNESASSHEIIARLRADLEVAVQQINYLILDRDDLARRLHLRETTARDLDDSVLRMDSHRSSLPIADTSKIEK
jgi:hypothetical protein